MIFCCRLQPSNSVRTSRTQRALADDICIRPYMPAKTSCTPLIHAVLLRILASRSQTILQPTLNRGKCPKAHAIASAHSVVCPRASQREVGGDCSISRVNHLRPLTCFLHTNGSRLMGAEHQQTKCRPLFWKDGRASSHCSEKASGFCRCPLSALLNKMPLNVQSCCSWAV